MAVFIDLGGLRRFTASLRAQLNGQAPGPVDAMFKQWGARYLGFTRRRFVTQSRGGGEWPDLAISTKLARARGTKAGKKRFEAAIKRTAKQGSMAGKSRRQLKIAVVVGMVFQIMRNTGLLLAALTQGARGNFFRRIPGGIRVGFAGDIHGKRMTYARIASIHQRGLGNNPVRRILAAPDAATLKSMAGDAQRAITRLGRDSSIK